MQVGCVARVVQCHVVAGPLTPCPPRPCSPSSMLLFIRLVLLSFIRLTGLRARVVAFTQVGGFFFFFFFFF
uniref:Uncharacterized protein n=1 Tax=Physcomitrium patens TaxID=3218 RepID=A0A2K1KUT2_PHYPA|nr:hypothetical protein PHYPA_004522 [Physcomitrium patens]